MIKKILVPTDFSDSARVALQRAEGIARVLDAEIVLLHVRNEFVPDGVGFVPLDLWAQEEAVVDAALEAVLGELRARGTQVRSLQVLGLPFAEIVREVERESIDLIVMGTHGRHGVGRLVLGSVAEHVMRTAKVPVMVVRIFDDEQAQQDLPAKPATLSPQAVKAFRSILVPIDLRSPSAPAVQYAFEVAERLGATVHLLYAYPDVNAAGGWLGAMPFDSPYQQALDKLHSLALPHRGSGALASCVATCGDPAKVILDTALELGVDLIVLGTDTRGGLSRFLKGSVTAQVVRAASCAVMVLNAGAKAPSYGVLETPQVEAIGTP